MGMENIHYLLQLQLSNIAHTHNPDECSCYARWPERHNLTLQSSCQINCQSFVLLLSENVLNFYHLRHYLIRLA